VGEGKAGLAVQADEAFAQAQGAAADDAVARHDKVKQRRGAVAEGYGGEDRVHDTKALRMRDGERWWNGEELTRAIAPLIKR
jgi:hypothetical protein